MIKFIGSLVHWFIIVNSKNKWTLSPLGFDPDLSGPVGAVCNRTGLECLINSKIYYSSIDPIFDNAVLQINKVKPTHTQSSE